MKIIERQIRNHAFEIRFEADAEHPNWDAEPNFSVDGVPLNRGDFLAALSLLSVEVPK